MFDLQLSLEPPIARMVINRPERRNAMSDAMWRTLAKFCADIEACEAIKAVIVEGADGHFCAGADISEFDTLFADLDNARRYLHSIEASLNALAFLDRPTAAKVEGFCMGGGLAIALACDFRLAGESAQLSVPPAKLGLLYGVAETRLLVETVGPSAAKDLLFSGRRLDAREALNMGLVNGVVADGELDSAIERQAQLWTRLSGASIRGAKKAVRATLAGQEKDVRTLLEKVALGADFREGRAAFREKRAPDFLSRA